MLTTKAQARKLAGLRKTHTGGRPCIPTRCEKCGTMCPSRTLAEVHPCQYRTLLRRKARKGGRPRIPTRRRTCGILCPSRRLAKAHPCSPGLKKFLASLKELFPA